MKKKFSVSFLYFFVLHILKIHYFIDGIVLELVNPKLFEAASKYVSTVIDGHLKAKLEWSSSKVGEYKDEDIIFVKDFTASFGNFLFVFFPY